ncbi:MAG: polyprenol monophosphomannose synthase [Candidatus Altiarchaeota archaeon]
MRASVVVPTYNEVKNLKGLVEDILSNADVEVVVVDDGSPDGTGELADQLAVTYGIKVIHRKGKLGLSSAILDGLNASSGEIIGVMDADFSHPPRLIPKLIQPILNGDAGMVFASRYIEGGGVENWPIMRRLTSRGAKMLARPLTGVRDCMSGYFFLRREVIEGVKLDAVGFKIGLEILVKGKYGRVVEVPYIFRDRRVGESKLNLGEYINYLRHLYRLYRYRLGLG